MLQAQEVPAPNECENEVQVLPDREFTTEEKEKDRKKSQPEFGTAEDFMLTQAAAYLKGQPIKRSKSRLE